MIETRCLLVFSGLAVRSAGGVLLTSNPVHGVLFLVLTFRNACGLMRLMEAEFRAILFIVVYVGAIAVLFLFVVMMLNLGTPTGAGRVKSEEGLQGRLLRALTVERGGRVSLSWLSPERERASMGWAMEAGSSESRGVRSRLGESGRPLRDRPLARQVDWEGQVDGLTNLETLGQVLYTDYALYVVLAGFVLLVAMIGAIVLTLKERSFAVAKRQQAWQQISRDSARAVVRLR